MFTSRRLVWFSALLLLCSPLLLQLSGTRIGKPLKGWQAPPKTDSLSWRSWVEGRWQVNVEEQARHRLKARPFQEIEKQRQEIEKQDLIVIFITEANIGACCWGMTGAFYRMYRE